MGAVAAAMQRQGDRVTGSDAAIYPPMSTFLAAEGITLSEGYAADNIPNTATTIVVGNAISRGNPEIEEVLRRKLRYISLPELLKEKFLRGKRNLVVTGTHGKTTTSSLLAWFLVDGGLDPSHMIGGIPRNLGRGGYFSKSDFCVIEGDEYDTAFFDKRSKFHHYLPEVAIINNIEFDHADIYDNLDQIMLTFRRLLLLVPDNGLALINGDDPNCLALAETSPVPLTKVGFSDHCEQRIDDVNYRQDGTQFRINGEAFSTPMIGEFNLRNTAMAVLAARFVGLNPAQIRRSLQAWKGIARRQEIRGQVRGVTVIDDFAHHPTAIHQAIAGLRQRFPDQSIRVIFEPRSNTTRRNIFQSELAQALATSDEAIVAQIENPGKVPSAQRLDLTQLIETIKQNDTPAMVGENTQQIIDHLAATATPGQVMAILSNGGFDNIHQRLLDALETQFSATP